MLPAPQFGRRIGRGQAPSFELLARLGRPPRPADCKPRGSRKGTGALLGGIMAYPGSFWDEVVLAGKDSKASWLAVRRIQSSPL